MKSFTNVNPKTIEETVGLLEANQDGKTVVVGGGSDLVGMIKHRLSSPDRLVNLKSLKGLDTIESGADGVRIGALVTMDALSRDPVIQSKYKALADAAAAVATPQIRNVGTLGGNVAQRPWCWYFRSEVLKCLKKGGRNCYGRTGENQYHALLGGGPCFCVHPSDTAPALVALKASFRIMGPAGEAMVPAADFFTLPVKNVRRENVLQADQLILEIRLPPAEPGSRSAYTKLRDRGGWDHAVVAVASSLEIVDGVCRNATVALGGIAPIPWALPAVGRMLLGQRVTPELALKAGEVAVKGVKPLAKNAYKVTIAKNLVRRQLLALA